MSAAGTGPRRSLLDAVARLCEDLRAAGVAVSTADLVDALEALKAIEVTDRGQFRAALAATIVKRSQDQDTFDRLFSAHFALVHALQFGGAEETTSQLQPQQHRDAAARAAQAADEGVPSDAVLRALLDALRSGDRRALEALAASAVAAYGGLDSDRVASERYYLYRVLRQLELSQLLQRALREALDDPDALDAGVVRQELAAHIEALRRAIAEEIRRQLVALKGDDVALEVLRPGIVEEIDLVEMTRGDIPAMRDLVRPLARKLAARIAAKRRRHLRGRLDMRRTMRHSLQTGGVPLYPAFRRPKVSKADLVVLADISGSMAQFATFTMSLLHALSEEIARLRSFAFVDGVDEVTEAFESGIPELSARNLLARSNVIAGDGHSDYGAVLHRFRDRFGDALSAKTTLIVIGDARSNYREAGADVLAQLHRRVRKIYWLNPEPASDWDTADSVVAQFVPSCDAVIEVRNLRQLENAILHIV